LTNTAQHRAAAWNLSAAVRLTRHLNLFLHMMIRLHAIRAATHLSNRTTRFTIC